MKTDQKWSTTVVGLHRLCVCFFFRKKVWQVCVSFSDAIGKGALPLLETLYVDDGPLGTEHPQLQAACEARGIRLS